MVHLRLTGREEMLVVKVPEARLAPSDPPVLPEEFRVAVAAL